MPKCDFNLLKFIDCNFIEITLRHGCSPVNLLHIFGTTFLKNTSGWLLLNSYNKRGDTTDKLLDLTEANPKIVDKKMLTLRQMQS